MKIKEKVKVENNFAFNDVCIDEIFLLIKEIDKKECKTFRQVINSSGIISGKLCEIYNSSKNSGTYPNSLKLADVIPNHKHEETTSLKNYRPVSLLPGVSKLFERKMSNEILNYIEKYLSPYIFEYRKGRSTEQCLLLMIETWKKAMDNKGLQVLFELIFQRHLIALIMIFFIGKLSDKSSLKYLYSYLIDRKQRTKVVDSYSSWRDLVLGYHKDRILGSLLINIFINDLFFFIAKVRLANYADDNTAYATNDRFDNLIKILEAEMSVLHWFRMNCMKSNDDKYKLIVANTNNLSLNMGNATIEAS